MASKNRPVAFASGWVTAAAYDGTVRMWHLPDGEERVRPAHKTYALTVVASPDRSLIASSGDEGDVLLWNLDETDNEIKYPELAYLARQIESSAAAG